MNSELLPYNPIVLNWAREKSNHTIEDVAKKFNKPASIISQWEEGTSSPTYIQLETLAYKIYKRPLAIFFFTEPPKDTSGKELFRTLPEHEFKQISPKLTYIIRKSQALQENLRELNEGKNPTKIKLIDSFYIDKNDTVEQTAGRFREYIGLTLKEQQSWKDSSQALKCWREIFEDRGIYIFKEAFNDDSFSGFCIYDNTFPIIYINNSKTKTRQIFTLFHELAHILFKTGGIDTRSDDYINYLDDESKRIEVYCNKFAGEFLVPKHDFLVQIMDKGLDEKLFSKLATLYSVSREVILRKLLDMDKIEQNFYLEKSLEWIEEAKKAKINKKKKDTRIPQYTIKKAYLGKKYINLVFNALYQDKISRIDALEYLGIKNKRFLKFEMYYLKDTNV